MLKVFLALPPQPARGEPGGREQPGDDAGEHDRLLAQRRINLVRIQARGERDDVYVTVSRLVPYKRIDVIIDAFRHMPQRRLTVVGNGPERA